MKPYSLSLCFFISLLILSGNKIFSQNFTKITSAGNPIVTDMAQSGGGSWVDINNDGLLDLFVSNGNLTSENNALYLNSGSGNFIKVITGNIVNDGGSSIGSTWADYDTDGFIDCFVTNRNNFGNFLYQGTGDTVFFRITTGSAATDISNSNSSSWVDLNNDGDVDLYVVNFSANDFMYTNGFTLISNPTNSMVMGTQFSIPGAWADYNNDNKQDAFIGNSGTQNDILYTNIGSLNFTPATLNDARASLGASWGDYDNDGDMDLFVANYLNHGNLFYINSGAPGYNLTKIDTGVLAEAGNCVGSAWGDIDNDGDLDLYVTNDGGTGFLYLNNGAPDYWFTKITTGILVNDPGAGFGCVFADYDNDGHLDLFVANRQIYPNFLYHNNGNSNNWITIKCRGISSNITAIGARVHVKAIINGSPVWQMQEVSGQTGYNSQNLWLHFGLAQATIADTIVIRWPSGTVDTCLNINSNIFYMATEGQCLLPTSSQAINIGGKRSLSVSPNPATGSVKISYHLAQPGKVTVNTYDSSGRKISRLARGKQAEGLHEIIFSTEKLSPGIYDFELVTEQLKECIKIVVN